MEVISSLPQPVYFVYICHCNTDIPRRSLVSDETYCMIHGPIGDLLPHRIPSLGTYTDIHWPFALSWVVIHCAHVLQPTCCPIAYPMNVLPSHIPGHLCAPLILRAGKLGSYSRPTFVTFLSYTGPLRSFHYLCLPPIPDHPRLKLHSITRIRFARRYIMMNSACLLDFGPGVRPDSSTAIRP